MFQFFLCGVRAGSPRAFLGELCTGSFTGWVTSEERRLRKEFFLISTKNLGLSLLEKCFFGHLHFGLTPYVFSWTVSLLYSKETPATRPPTLGLMCGGKSPSACSSAQKGPLRAPEDAFCICVSPSLSGRGLFSLSPMSALPHCPSVQL